MASGEAIALGVDLGGTKIEAIVLRCERRARAGATDAVPDAVEVLARRRVATERDRGYDAVLATTAALAHDTARDAGLDVAAVPVGVGMPGGVTRRGGLVKNSNTQCLNGRPFRGDLARALGRAVAFENDANCFALAEARLGAAAAQRDGVVFGVIMGTGVGGGLVVRGEVWPGPQGIAGEWGHHAVWPDRPRRCFCGNTGCVELYASGPAVEADYAARAGVARPLAEIAARRAADGDDPHADAAIDGLLETFGRALANVIDIVDPSAVVLGGGVSNLGVLYTEGVARVARYVCNDELTTPIVRNALGDAAGVYGAALLVAVAAA